MKNWSQDQQNNLLHLRDDLKMSWLEIAKQMNSTIAACRNKYRRLKGIIQ